MERWIARNPQPAAVKPERAPAKAAFNSEFCRGPIQESVGFEPTRGTLVPLPGFQSGSLSRSDSSVKPAIGAFTELSNPSALYCIEDNIRLHRKNVDDCSGQFRSCLCWELATGGFTQHFWHGRRFISPDIKSGVPSENYPNN